jgi:hypothetical protein
MLLRLRRRHDCYSGRNARTSPLISAMKPTDTAARGLENCRLVDVLVITNI